MSGSLTVYDIVVRTLSVMISLTMVGAIFHHYRYGKIFRVFQQSYLIYSWTAIRRQMPAEAEVDRDREDAKEKILFALETIQNTTVQQFQSNREEQLMVELALEKIRNANAMLHRNEPPRQKGR
jgi:hypothetical protein